MTKKKKIVLGVGITMLATIVTSAVLLTSLHFVGTAKNNRTDIAGSDPLDHVIESELTEEEREHNREILENENSSNSDGLRRDDKYFEEDKAQELPDEKPSENDERYDDDTDSNNVVYKKKTKENDKNL